MAVSCVTSEDCCGTRTIRTTTCSEAESRKEQCRGVQTRDRRAFGTSISTSGRLEVCWLLASRYSRLSNLGAPLSHGQ
jgi:hypothetical protein